MLDQGGPFEAISLVVLFLLLCKFTPHEQGLRTQIISFRVALGQYYLPNNRGHTNGGAGIAFRITKPAAELYHLTTPELGTLDDLIRGRAKAAIFDSEPRLRNRGPELPSALDSSRGGTAAGVEV